MHAPARNVPTSDCPLCGAGGAREGHRDQHGSYWECRTCALVFLSPEHRLGFADEVERYRLHRNSEDDPEYLKFLSRLATPMIERVPAGSLGLDYGCGPAPALALLLTRSGRPTASYDPVFHPDETLLATQYDFVTSCEVLEHVHSPLPFLARLEQLARPGGHLGIMTRWYDGSTPFAQWHYRRDPTHVCFYGPNTLRWIADHFGWDLAMPATDVAVYTMGARRGTP